MCVAGHRLARSTHGSKQEVLRCAPLMGRYHIFDAEDLTHNCFEALIAGRTRVGFIATHERCPLLARHGSGAAIGEKVDDHIIRLEREQVQVSLLNQALPSFPRGHVNRFDALDPKGFDDGLHAAR